MDQDRNGRVISKKKFRQLIAETFNCPTEKIKFSTFFLEFEDQYKDVCSQIQYLGALYDLRDIKTSQVIFESVPEEDNKNIIKYYGLTDRGDNYGQNFVSINFGDRSFRAFENETFCVVRPTEAFKYIVTHEFAHVLTSSERNMNEAISAKYWKEIVPIWHQYIYDVMYNVSRLELFSIYSCKNIDEFHAEAFTSYHLSDCPSDVVKKVGLVIDKYFKKSKRKEEGLHEQRLQTTTNMKRERLR